MGLVGLICHPQTSCISDKLDKTMARLVAVCREGDEDYPFLVRQIPLHIDDSLTVNYPTPHHYTVNAYGDHCCKVANSALSRFGSCVSRLRTLDQF